MLIFNTIAYCGTIPFDGAATGTGIVELRLVANAILILCIIVVVVLFWVSRISVAYFRGCCFRGVGTIFACFQDVARKEFQEQSKKNFGKEPVSQSFLTLGR